MSFINQKNKIKYLIHQTDEITNILDRKESDSIDKQKYLSNLKQSLVIVNKTTREFSTDWTILNSERLNEIDVDMSKQFLNVEVEFPTIDIRWLPFIKVVPIIRQVGEWDNNEVPTVRFNKCFKVTMLSEFNCQVILTAGLHITVDFLNEIQYEGKFLISLQSPNLV